MKRKLTIAVVGVLGGALHGEAPVVREQVEVLEESLRSMDMTLEALVQSASEGKKRRRR